MCHFAKGEADTKLGGLTALAKAKAGLVLNECAQCAQILFGGNGYTETGQGELVAKIAREIQGARVPGGSEDVLDDSKSTGSASVPGTRWLQAVDLQ